MRVRPRRVRLASGPALPTPPGRTAWRPAFPSQRAGRTRFSGAWNPSSVEPHGPAGRAHVLADRPAGVAVADRHQVQLVRVLDGRREASRSRAKRSLGGRSKPVGRAPTSSPHGRRQGLSDVARGCRARRLPEPTTIDLAQPNRPGRSPAACWPAALDEAILGGVLGFVSGLGRKTRPSPIGLSPGVGRNFSLSFVLRAQWWKGRSR